MILLYYCLFSLVLAIDFGVNNKNAYGPYTANFVKFKPCELQQKVAESYISMQHDKLFINLSLTTPCVLSKSKSRITVTTPKDGENKTLFRYNLKDPCQHFTIGPLLREFLGANRNCKIDKGSYTINLNLTQTFNIFFGTAFFYGRYDFKSVIRCTTGNLICVSSTVEMKKKNSD